MLCTVFLPHEIAIEFTEFSLGFWVQGPKPTGMQGDRAVLPYPHLFHMLQECLEQICIVTKHRDFSQKKWSFPNCGDGSIHTFLHIFTIFLLGESSINPSYLRVPSGSWCPWHSRGDLEVPPGQSCGSGLGLGDSGSRSAWKKQHGVMGAEWRKLTSSNPH